MNLETVNPMNLNINNNDVVREAESSKNLFDPTEQLDYDYSVHMDELVKQILAYNQKDGLNKFEEISMYVKKKISKLSVGHKIISRPQKPLIEMTDQEKLIFSQINYKKPKKLEKVENLMDDVLEKARILENVGIDLGKPNWYKLKLAMKKLMINEKASTLKFFGKIYGRQSDYYIVYGKLKNYPFQKYSKDKFPNPEKISNHFEPKGLEGVNSLTFWVSNNFLEEWFQLPDIYPHHLSTARQFKYIFTGDLKAKVNSFVPFKGNESHLLKCTILRIMHACFVVPEGYLETKAIENSEETFGIDIGDKCTQVVTGFTMPSNEDLLQPTKWQHEFAYIFPNGKIIETDPEATQVPRMRDIDQDAIELRKNF